jgi:hypothetical protein
MVFAISIGSGAVAVIAAAFAAGRSVGKRQTIPWRVIFQLAEHRRRCLGHEPARIERELGAGLAIEPWVWREAFLTRLPLGREAAVTRP